MQTKLKDLIRSQEWKEKNKERCQEVNRAYYLKNKERISLRNRKWAEENQEKVKEINKKLYYKWKETPEFKLRVKKYSKNYYNKNRDKFLEWSRKNREYYKKYRISNRDLYLVANHKRRALISQSEKPLTSKEWIELKKKYNYTCPCCKKKEPEIKLTIDHIKAVSKGGLNNIENIQPLCPTCNFTKKTKEIKY